MANNFIETIAPLIRNSASKNGYLYPSAIIAQAVIESNYGESLLSSKYHNYFGMKCGSSWTGESVNMKTHEEYQGKSTVINDNFRAYASMEDSVNDYFHLITSLSRYANLKESTSFSDYLSKLCEDGYCTSSTYVETCTNVIKEHNLTIYDLTPTLPPTTPTPSTHFEIGKNYTTTANLAVRKAPSKNSPLVGYKNLTPDGKKHDTNKNSCLETGTTITCKEVSTDSDGIEWIRTPSGWVCSTYLK